MIDAAQARADYNNAGEKQQTLEYLRAAREVFLSKME